MTWWALFAGFVAAAKARISAEWLRARERLERDWRLAAGLLTVGAILFYAWQWFPSHAAFVWNIAGSLTRIILMWALIRGRGGWVLAVGLWWTAEELLLIGCNGLYMVAPWPVRKGEAICSALLGYDLGTLGLLVVAILAWQLARMRARGT